MLIDRAKAVIPALLISVLAIPSAVSQSASPGPTLSPRPLSFDVVSVKANKTDEAFPGSMIHADGFYAQNATPVWVMFYAYNIEAQRNPNDFVGLPDWAKTERFDIIAKVSAVDVATWIKMPDDQRRSLVRSILENRFGLRVRVETSEQPIYALVVAKGGPKMQAVEVPAHDVSPYGPEGYVAMSMHGSIGQHATMGVLADYLSKQDLGRPVQDHTGLSGHYNFTLRFTPFPSGANAAEATVPANSDAPFIFNSLQEQLGLKLEPSKGPVTKYVIEHMERPAAN